jgi:(R)-2-hydroxyacyl-CoA dehydratese activating ATPase
MGRDAFKPKHASSVSINEVIVTGVNSNLLRTVGCSHARADCFYKGVFIMNYIGIDIGSTCAKTAVLNEKKEIIREFVQPTGWSSIDTAEEILQKLKFAGINLSDDSSCCVATGYGRISVPYADKAVTEITCHALGAVHLFHQPDLTVIDIGGQDTKIIQIEQGFVKDFIMNDKCAAGTGRFLEVMANTLSLRPNEMFELARLDSDTTISSMCTVFAESEVIGLIGKGEPKENIAYAVVDSTIRKVTAQLSRMNGEMSTFCLTGGLCECEYIREALSKKLGKEVISSPDARYAGAIGAALSAMKIR